MTEMPAFSKGVSEQSEASFVESEKMTEDVQSVKDLVEYGLPVDVQNAFTACKELSVVTYDDFIPEQREAKAHIEAALVLFRSSYSQSVAYEVKEANRILELYPGSVQREGRAVTSVNAVSQSDGSALLLFQTDHSETSNE
jgi:hypothetical protein